MIRVDSHHHFWKYSSKEYGWISESTPVLRRDYLPEDLLREIQSTHIDWVVSVQARQDVVETDFLLDFADKHDWIRGVVGWAPFAGPNIEAVFERYRNRSRLKGWRHVVQDEPDESFLDDPKFNKGISRLLHFNWSYDLLIYAKQLPMTIRFVDRHPNQPFILDHIAKPTIKSSRYDHDWDRDIRELAKRANVVCKFSALVTEVRDEKWSVETLRPYWNASLGAFGIDRLMFGSDWPVCLLRASYADWVAAVGVLASELSNSEQERFWGGNATRAYKLDS